MRKLSVLTLAAAMAVASASAASATDLYVAPSGGGAYSAPSDTDWSGFYFGVFGTGASSDGIAVDTYVGVGKWVGLNVDTGSIIFGIDVALTYYPDFGGFADPTWNVEAAGRVGVAVGSSGMIFALAGVGTASNPAWGSEPYWVAGAGGELKLGQNVAFRGEYRFKSVFAYAQTSHNFLGGLVWYAN